MEPRRTGSRREPPGGAPASRILLVDDHAIFREGLKLLLEDQPDMRVVGEASTGLEAVSRLLELAPDIVIMDIKMPRMGGIDATREILRRVPSTKVIVLSMYSEEREITGAFKAGACGYVLKEDSGAELLDAIRSVREDRRYLSRRLANIFAHAYLGGGEPPDPVSKLSARERQVLQLVVEGRSSKEIAASTCLSQKTVETYRSRLMSKLGIDNLPDLVKFAIAQGLIGLESETPDRGPGS
jgi:DNA-binding NarL/FixJ family response regulator